MTRTRKTLKSLLALFVALAMTVALGVSMLAAAADTVTETVVVSQVIEKGTEPSRTSYTYWLTPENEAYPLPTEVKDQTPSDGKYKIGTIDGNSTDKTSLVMTFEIDKSQPGSYVYYLEKTPETPAGDTFTLEKWKFGFRVTADEKTGELVAFPEVCVGGDSTLSDYDANGYPTTLTMVNSIKGKPTTTTTTTTTTKKGTTRTATTYRNGTVRTVTVTGNSTRASWVNTGDSHSLILWVAVLGVAALGLIILIIVRRRKEDDDEQDF